ncbi:putative conserved hypothetical protein [Colletotrichum sublineola]|uniref:Fe2OG dioxygenase domain-containing protein n=1 Tax=Colletotrichum sublineola TaxID=1173701 RepID=A0A066XLU2_COLSU|nr:putative conserved hypothetical protein [Colletotrichum sublineola]
MVFDPKEAEAFRQSNPDYCERLAHDLYWSLGKALHIDDGGYFSRIHSENNCHMTWNFYPSTPLQKSGLKDAKRLNAHTDFGTLTIVFQDVIGGLEVHDGHTFRPIPPVPGAMVVNVGDMLEQLSNGRWKSALHRVVVLSQHQIPGSQGLKSVEVIDRPKSLSLAGKNAIVTGSSRGIGKQVVLELASRGANVAICFVLDLSKPAAKELAEDLAFNGAGYRLVERALAGLKADMIHILVNNAALDPESPTPVLESLGHVFHSNIIAIGLTMTDYHVQDPPEVLEELSRLPSAAKRLAMPDDVLQIVAFLASDASRWINRDVIQGNGGMQFS